MVITPKMRGFICTTAHPDGIEKTLKEQVAYAKNHKAKGPKRVLILGSSTGYGLAARIATTFSYDADTIGVFYERPAAGRRTATAGWYATAAFDKLAKDAGRKAYHINGDAFSKDIKEKAVSAIKECMPGGAVDLVIYSLAAPRRTVEDKTYSSVIQPIGESFHSKTVDFHTGEVSEVSIPPATPTEIAETVNVMGGEDWLWWMQKLKDADVLAEGATTFALSYLGPELTHPVYKDGTIGKAKEDLEGKAAEINKLLSSFNGKALVSVNKALVTQSSAAIPVVPLYISLLFRVMKEKNLHEGTIEQMVRLLSLLYPSDPQAKLPLDEKGRLRLDDWEMGDDVQKEVMTLWEQVTTENIDEISDIKGYQEAFYNLFGFDVSGINYEISTDPNRSLTLYP